nr:hypothetical protein [Rhodopirellula sp. SM50]
MNAPQRPPNADSPIPSPPNGEQEAENASPGGAGVAQEGGAEAAVASAMLADLKREMNRLQREIRLAIQAQLAQMSGRTLGSLEANRELARSIQEMLDAHGLRVRCTHCGHPAILRVSPRAGAAAGVFVFDHTIDGRRTFHGGRVLIPEIRLVAKPARKPRGEKKAG